MKTACYSGVAHPIASPDSYYSYYLLPTMSSQINNTRWAAAFSEELQLENEADELEVIPILFTILTFRGEDILEMRVECQCLF